MCNSYANGYCQYYGVEVSELNHRCERGKCMDDEESNAIRYICNIADNVKEMERISHKKCKCGSITFHDSEKDFAMCSECHSVIRKSNWTEVPIETFKGGQTIHFDNIEG